VNKKGKLIGQGRTAEIFEWNEHKILKLFREGFPTVAIENEFKVGLELFKKGVPVPETDDLVEENNRFGIIFERVYGPTMMHAMSSKPWKIVAEAQKMAELHKAIQIQIDNNIPSQKIRLNKNIDESKILSNKIKTDLFKTIEDLPDDRVLCHGDFHPDNIILSKNKVVIIDWMTATIGNPLSDVARTSILFKYGIIPEHKSKLETGIINFVRKKFFSEYLKHYIKITSSSKDFIEQWEVPHAAARLAEWIPPAEKEVLLNLVVSHFA
jgi:uncharacterized protein (TIGR02172 family)